MAKPRNDLLDRLQYLALRVVSMMLHCWPVQLNLAGARLLGDFMFAVAAVPTATEISVCAVWNPGDIAITVYRPGCSNEKR